MWAYLDVNEFTGCQDTKWRKAAKWLKEQFGVTNRAAYSWRRNQRHFMCMEVEDVDNRIKSKYWSYPTDIEEDVIEKRMAANPNAHRRIYYNCNNILLGEIDYGEPIESTFAL